MRAITEANTFDPTVNMYDLTDPVLGGLTGESNDPIIALTNRSRFLYNYQSSFTDIQFVTATSTITNTFLKKLIYINASANLTLTLAAIAGFLPGQTLHFKCKNISGKCAKILPAGSEVITDGSLARSIYLYDGEQISIVVRSSTEWEIVDAKGNFDIVGNDGLVRKKPRNSLIADGTTNLSRVDYARLWEQVSSDAIDDATWLSDPLYFRGLFSAGNGTTTFRVPDMRSMQLRGLDLGRGVSFTRISGASAAGGYEPDSLKSHNHGFPIGDGALPGTPGYIPDMNPLDGNVRRVTGQTDATGATETVGKNIGLIPIIYF